MSASTEQQQEKVNGAESAPQPMTALAEVPKPQIPLGPRGVNLQTFEDMFRFSTMVVRSRLAPKGFETPEAVMVALQMGAELGLSPMASLQNICVINGKPSVYGDCQLAVVRSSGLFDEASFSERIEGTGDGMKAVCSVRRLPNGNVATNEFSIADAKRAGLHDKTIWKQYPQRMLTFRARSWVLRDNFGDILLGFPSVEEMYGTNDPREVPSAVEVGPREALPAQPTSRTAALVQKLAPPAEAAQTSEPAAEEAFQQQEAELLPLGWDQTERQRARLTELIDGFEHRGKALDVIALECSTRSLAKVPDEKLSDLIARLEAEYAKGNHKK